MRSDSELVLSYLEKTKELEYTRQGDMFILWKMNDNILEIHDIYSEEDSGKMLKFALDFVESKQFDILEGYVDRDYSNKDRSIKILENFGMSFYKKTDDYLYFRLVKNG